MRCTEGLLGMHRVFYTQKEGDDALCVIEIRKKIDPRRCGNI